MYCSKGIAQNEEFTAIFFQVNETLRRDKLAAAGQNNASVKNIYATASVRDLVHEN